MWCSLLRLSLHRIKETISLCRILSGVNSNSRLHSCQWESHIFWHSLHDSPTLISSLSLSLSLSSDVRAWVHDSSSSISVFCSGLQANSCHHLSLGQFLTRLGSQDATPYIYTEVRLGESLFDFERTCDCRCKNSDRRCTSPQLSREKHFIPTCVSAANELICGTAFSPKKQVAVNAFTFGFL
jgi:hypothetical protein